MSGRTFAAGCAGVSQRSRVLRVLGGSGKNRAKSSIFHLMSLLLGFVRAAVVAALPHACFSPSGTLSKFRTRLPSRTVPWRVLRMGSSIRTR